jgi:hypothetical protein
VQLPTITIIPVSLIAHLTRDSCRHLNSYLGAGLLGDLMALSLPRLFLTLSCRHMVALAVRHLGTALLGNLAAALFGHLGAVLVGNLLAMLLRHAHALRLRNLVALLVGHVDGVVDARLDRHLLAVLGGRTIPGGIGSVTGQALLVVICGAFLLQLLPVRRSADLLVVLRALLFVGCVALVGVCRLTLRVVGGLAVVLVVGLADLVVLRGTFLFCCRRTHVLRHLV